MYSARTVFLQARVRRSRSRLNLYQTELLFLFLLPFFLAWGTDSVSIPCRCGALERLPVSAVPSSSSRLSPPLSLRLRCSSSEIHQSAVETQTDKLREGEAAGRPSACQPKQEEATKPSQAKRPPHKTNSRPVNPNQSNSSVYSLLYCILW